MTASSYVSGFPTNRDLVYTTSKFPLPKSPVCGTSVTLTLMGKQTLQRAFVYYSSARLRAARRKSAWNLVLIPPAILGWLGSWYGQFRIVWAFHEWLYPQHSFRGFWQEGISFASFVPSFLMLFGPFFGALCLGLIFANCVAWLILPARRKLDEESVSYPGTGFRESTVALIRLARWAVPIGLAIALTAASLLKSLR